MRLFPMRRRRFVRKSSFKPMLTLNILERANYTAKVIKRAGYGFE